MKVHCVFFKFNWVFICLVHVYISCSRYCYMYVLVCVVIIDIGREAAQAALSDAGLPYSCVEAVVASYCYGDPTCGEFVACQRLTFTMRCCL